MLNLRTTGGSSRAAMNPYHDVTTGRFTTGPGGSSSESQRQTTLATQQTHPLAHPAFVVGLATDISDVQPYVAAYGQGFEAQPLPEGITRGEPQQCYANASKLVLTHPEWTYAEGFAKSARTGDLTFFHAWLVDEFDRVIDPTWPDPEHNQYFGVKYDRKAYLKHLFKTKVYGVIGGEKTSAQRMVETGGAGLRSGTLKTLGGSGSGNFGHAGRPGQVGGSSRGGSSMARSARLRLVAHHLVVFHGTSSQAADAIKREGIIPRGSAGADAWGKQHFGQTPEEYFGLNDAEIADRNTSVFLAGDRDTAMQFARIATEMHPGSQPVLIIADVPDEQLISDPMSEPYMEAKIFKGTIPPHFVKDIQPLPTSSLPPGNFRNPVEEGAVMFNDDGTIRERALAVGTTRLYLIVLVSNEDLRAAGGPRSGNFGHAGRPGQVGGSAPRSGNFGHAGRRPGQIEGSAPTGTSVTTDTSSLGPTLTVAQFRERLQAKGYQTAAPDDLPEEVHQIMGELTEVETIPQSAAEGIERGLRDLQERAPGLHAVIQREVPLVIASYNPSRALATTPLSPGQFAAIIINGHPDAFLESRTTKQNTVTSKRLTQLTGDERMRECYRGVTVHESGHVLDGATGAQLSEAVGMLILREQLQHPQDDAVKILQQRLSNYAAAGPEEAAAELFSQIILNETSPHPMFEDVAKNVQHTVQRDPGTMFHTKDWIKAAD